jgi:hypothetical protein
MLPWQASRLDRKRREHLTGSERADLLGMLKYLPEFAPLQRFADRIDWLFDTPKDFQSPTTAIGRGMRKAPPRGPSTSGSPRWGA